MKPSSDEIIFRLDAYDDDGDDAVVTVVREYVGYAALISWNAIWPLAPTKSHINSGQLKDDDDDGE